ncbi:MAG: isoleucine--tRNA ligase [Chthoniobacterales bacterium]
MSGYKDSLNLPKTAFPMKAGLTAKEPAQLKRWESDGIYAQIQKARSGRPTYILHDGPPFANGDVHMGTALNKIFKDFVIKSKTMANFHAPYVPGWDCHGLPIEFKVVKESQGLQPVEVRKRSEKYARKFVDTQKKQFKRLGVFGEWDDPYLTLNPSYEAEILRAFGTFVEKGLVYQSAKPVFWSTGAQTALAEAEVEYKDKTTPAVFVRFPITSGPLAEKAAMVIWTTTPWTLPSNLAIAVHPEHDYVRASLGKFGDVVVAEALLESLAEKCGETAEIQERFKGSALEGVTTQHPFLERSSTIYTADFVTLSTGTGAVHIAPGHGDDDYLLGIKHGLELLAPVDDQGRYTEGCQVSDLVGKYVFDANEDIITMLSERGHLLAREDILHSYPHCWRSKTPVIFRAVEQFFIRIDELRKEALDAVDSVEWLPAWGKSRIRGTVESRPDWCISRQRTWGVPLPIFYTKSGEPVLDKEVIEKVAKVVEEKGTNAWFELDDAAWSELVGLPEGTTRRSDTLDVWIDSGVSHRAVLDRREGLSAPADLYVEATDQHRGWFQSSLLTSVALRGGAPYKKVFTHGFVVDVDTREKVSKSAQGTYQKPMDAEHFVNNYGADLVRLWAASVDAGDDVPFSEEMFKRLGDSYRRIRNTLRILLGNIEGFDTEKDGVAFEAMPLVDRWILGRMQSVVAACREAYEKLEFHRAYQLLVQFCSVDLSSLYIDITKDRLYCDAKDSLRRRATQTAMREVFDNLTRLLAPILAFTAEEAWSYHSPEQSVHLELFPEVDEAKKSSPALTQIEQWLEIRSKVGQAIEEATKEGIIQKPLEAEVEITLPESLYNSFAEAATLEELEEFLVLSHVKLTQGETMAAKVTKTTRHRCERCWRHRDEVSKIEKHPELCERCSTAVDAAAQNA